jgi:hypothetical protein
MILGTDGSSASCYVRELRVEEVESSTLRGKGKAGEERDTSPRSAKGGRDNDIGLGIEDIHAHGPNKRR